MIGQSNILQTMKKDSKELTFPQVMIFRGETGSGKSTLAYITAALLNCENPVVHDDGHKEPCGECSSCKDVFQERFNQDVRLYNASTMGKDSVVELEKVARARPFFSPNKVIIIDEAQELSQKSFGVTLPLLEKTRSNVYFILCTMDSTAFHKAVKTRTMEFDFKPVHSDTIAEYLFRKMEEHPDIDMDSIPDAFFQDGIFLISEYAEGSVRAAIQYLDRCVRSEIYDTETIEKELGIISNTTLTELIYKLLSGDVKFFSQLRKYDSIEDFFNKSWTALLEAKLIYNNALTDVKLPPWKKESSTKIMRYSQTVDTVLRIYEEIFESGQYMKPTYVQTKLWSGIFEVPRIHQSNTQKRKRRVIQDEGKQANKSKKEG